MATITKRKYPTNPDVQQGPIGKKKKASKKVVDIAPATTILSETEQTSTITQEKHMTESNATPTAPTRTFQYEKTTKYGAVIYRCPGLGTATFTKTEFPDPDAPPAEVTITAGFKDEAALTNSEIEKIKKLREKAQKSLEKTQARLAGLDAKLEGTPAAEVVPA